MYSSNEFKWNFIIINKACSGEEGVTKHMKAVNLIPSAYKDIELLIGYTCVKF